MPRSFDPDTLRQVQRHMASGMTMFSHSVIWRKYISASAGDPDMGISDKLMYQSRSTQMQLKQLSLEEAQLVGGQDIYGSYEIVTTDPVGLRDEVIYDGETYRVQGLPDHELLGGVIYYRGIIQRASITGFYA